MNNVTRWSSVSNRDNIAFCSVLCVALSLLCAGSLMSVVEPEALLATLAEAATTAAQLLA